MTSLRPYSVYLGIKGAFAVFAIGNLSGVRTALTVASLILSPALLLYARAVRHRGNPDAE